MWWYPQWYAVFFVDLVDSVRWSSNPWTFWKDGMRKTTWLSQIPQWNLGDCEEWKYVTDCDNGDIQISHLCFNLRGALGLRLANIEEQADSLRWWCSGWFWLDCRCSPSSRSWHRFLSWGRNRGSEKDVGGKNWSKVTTSCRNGSQNPEAYKYLGWRWSTNIQELHNSMTQLFILVLSSCPRLDVWCREHVVKLSNTWQSQGEAYCSIKFQARHPVFVNTSQIHHIHFSSADNGCV